MARRKSTDSLLVGLMLAAGILWAIGQGLEFVAGLPPTFWSVITTGVAVVVVTLVIKWIVQQILDAHARSSVSRKVAAIVNEHLPSLVRRRVQLVRQDAYGKAQLDSWIKELNYFVDAHITPRLTPREHWALVSETQAMIVTVIDARVEQEARENPSLQAFSDDLTPSEFEAFCAEELRRAGWNARVTLQSRDQGVDVVAEKGRVRIVLQCKLYKRPVGNKAVQEAAAARAHEKADFGVVVTNHRFTQDAEQLAATNSILLLHYTDLRNLDALLRPNRTSADLWYYDDGKGQVGPLGLQELKESLLTLPNPENVYVWCSRFADWKLAKDVPEISVSSRTDFRRLFSR